MEPIESNPHRVLIWRCETCGAGPYEVFADQLPVHHHCTVDSLIVIGEVDYAALLPEADRLLLGDRLAELLAAIGIPPCAGCEARKRWVNKAHLWISGLWNG